MHDRYLEITFRRGKAIAAYVYLPRMENDKSWRVVKEANGLLVDMAEDGRPIGIEIISPKKVSWSVINETLAKYSLPLIDREEIAPLEPVV
jgi:hypothetical protein